MIPRHNIFQAVNNRNIYNALLSTLIWLKPKHCLEIGTFQGQSAEVFQYYFDTYQPSGSLITIDIKIYQQLPYKNVRQLQVHPHVTNSTTWHYVTEEEILPHVEDSVAKNIAIIREITDQQFDFCFLDGDHQCISAECDMEIATTLLQEPKYILFDDINDPLHECDEVYQMYKRSSEWHSYEYEDWNEWVGAGLLWLK